MSAPTQTPKAVVEAYVDGTRNRDISLLEQIFHEDAVMTGWLGGDLLHGGPEPFYGALEANEISPDYASEIVEIVETGQIAVATLAEQNLLGLSFTNHFHLAQQDDGTWRITSKLFRHD
jgi:ketosteroid isomerase-like protein